MRRGNDLTLIFIPVGEACLIEHGLCALYTGLIKVKRVVVAHGYKVYPAVKENVDVGGFCKEGEGGGCVVISQLLVGEGTLQICQRVFIFREVLHRIFIGIGCIVSHSERQPHRVVFKVGGSPEGIVSDE